MDESCTFRSPKSLEADALLSQSKPNMQYGDMLAVKVFRNCMVSNTSASLFLKIRDRIIKQFAFYRCIIVDT